MNENRDESSGQFTSASAEPLLGTDQLAKDMGFSKMPEPVASEPELSTIEQEAANLKASRQTELPAETVEIRYQDASGEKIDPNETVTQERATRDLSAYHTAMNDTAERHVNSDFRNEVLKQREALLKANPDLAPELGLDAEETLAEAKAAKAEAATEAAPTEARQAPQAEPDAFDSIPELADETKEALRKPQVRQYLEAQTAEAEQTKQAYSAGLNQAHQFGQGALLAIAPELAQVPVERWAEAIQIINQTDPLKAQMLGKTLSNVAALQERQQLVQSYQQEEHRRAIDNWRTQQNEIINKARPTSYAERAQFAEDLVAAGAEFGVTKADIVRGMENNPLLHSAFFQALAYDGVQYQKMQKSARARPTRDIPPVTKPGHASATPRGDAAHVKALERQLSNATTQQQQLKIGAQLLRAKRAG